MAHQHSPKFVELKKYWYSAGQAYSAHAYTFRGYTFEESKYWIRIYLDGVLIHSCNPRPNNVGHARDWILAHIFLHEE